MTKNVTWAAPSAAHWPLLAIATLATVTSCGDDEAVAGGSRSLAVTPIGPAGGVVVARGGSIRIDVPAGAVAAETQITASVATQAPAGHIGDALEFGPAGLVFARPVRITVRVNPLLFGGDALRPGLTLATVNAAGNWQRAANAELLDNWSVTGLATHFSVWAAVDSEQNQVDDAETAQGRMEGGEIEGPEIATEGMEGADPGVLDATAPGCHPCVTNPNDPMCARPHAICGDFYDCIIPCGADQACQQGCHSNAGPECSSCLEAEQTCWEINGCLDGPNVDQACARANCTMENLACSSLSTPPDASQTLCPCLLLCFQYCYDPTCQTECFDAAVTADPNCYLCYNGFEKCLFDNGCADPSNPDVVPDQACLQANCIDWVMGCLH